MSDLRSGSRGVLPLDGRLAPWMSDLFSRPDEAAGLVATYGSPVNVLDFSSLAGNAAELIDAAAAAGVQARVFVARKANKALGLVDAAIAAGLGVDVASHGELTQCLEAQVAPDDLIVSAAVKNSALLGTCAERGVPVSLDNADELDDLIAVAGALNATVRVGLRLAVVHPDVAPTRFGLTTERWIEALAVRDTSSARVEGVHFHLNGYSAGERAEGLRQACRLVDELRAAGHPVTWIDMGGGVPMNYLEDEAQWRAFWRAVDEASADEVTWRGDRLGVVDVDSDRPSPSLYPYWQREIRGAWLTRVLAEPGLEPEQGVAAMLIARDVELRLEPGRSMLDGCGITLAAVAATKETSDGVPLVALHMNRTQVRSTSVDFLVDPVLLRPSGARAPRPVDPGFLVGAYCVEEELLLRRRLTFADGVSRDDVVAFVNTGGYLMHILESASHQLPLSRTVTRSQGEWRQDRIDAL